MTATTNHIRLKCPHCRRRLLVPLESYRAGKWTTVRLPDGDEVYRCKFCGYGPVSASEAACGKREASLTESRSAIPAVVLAEADRLGRGG